MHLTEYYIGQNHVSNDRDFHGGNYHFSLGKETTV